MDFDISPGGVIVARQKLIVPCTPLLPTSFALEKYWDVIEADMRKVWEKFFKLPSLKEKILMMSGSLGNASSKSLSDAIWGATAYTAPGTHYHHLYTATIDDTFTGATAGKAAYTSYAALALTNNTTIFAAGSGTTTYTKTWPSDAAKSWPTSTGGTAPTVTFLGILDGNLGTSADHGEAWCSVTSTVINTGDTPQLAQNAISDVQD
jgi:hypothetical protein